MVDAIVEDRELVEFELVHLQYVRALHRESAARRTQLAHEARRAAKGDEARTIAAVLIESESAIQSGDLLLAEQTLTAGAAFSLGPKPRATTRSRRGAKARQASSDSRSLSASVWAAAKSRSPE